ncbi:probable galacturan 1,4-alpha-galacturonidase SALK6 [Spinacia oleracea]|uniref:Probable galacturan 1,4-alpha-galacturonidase SALK6 n=1 Tax=Spinacia oleracea TaxID=3562 RepID=A0A9R0JSK2_SPIOL|nr:probable galacturan 1,4-alpha-galacturonidase SALK6 [Spinacia oleracea]
MAFKLNYTLILFSLAFYLLVLEINGRTHAPEGDTIVFDITKNGAKPGTNVAKAFMRAWSDACASKKRSKVLVPKGKYLLSPITLKGPCQTPITIEILGNFKAASDLASFKGEDAWFEIDNVDGLTITAPKGAGVFDGQGKEGWKNNHCVKTFGSCIFLPHNFRFNYLTNSKIIGITSLNSKLFHMTLQGCKNLEMTNMNITAPGDSPNTDGIHIGRSDGITIRGVKIATGDDCISFGDGSKNILVEHVTCGPGHGISVGSLGRYPNEQPVSNITVRDCTIKNTLNGVRVKTWGASYESSASLLHFEDITIQNVTFPVIVDQEYCPQNHCKQRSSSRVKISNVRFKNVKGTSGTKDAVQLICSNTAPCNKVELTEIDLKYNGKDGPAVSKCKFVKPILTGKQNPRACDAPAAPVIEVAESDS